MSTIVKAIRGFAVAAAMGCAADFVVAQTEPETEPSVLAVRKALPAVVNINTERIVRRKVRDPMQDFFDQFYGGPMRPPRELRQTLQSLGSGFIVDAAGYIVTNEHVVERAADLKIQVTTQDGKVHEARFISADDATDLALIKIDAPGPLPFISLDDLSPNLLGQTVLALGNPLGYGSSVSRGILSAVDRTVTVENVEYKSLLQTDAAINPGNSGGPLIDLGGKLTGINSVKMAFTPQGVPTQGLGFAIPGKVVRERVVEMRKGGSRPLVESPAKAAQKRFGITAQDLTRELAESFGFEAGKGVLISEVEQSSPADEAGLTRGLVILRVGRYDIASAAGLDKVLSKADPGEQADFTVASVRRLRGRLVPVTEMVTLTAR